MTQREKELTQQLAECQAALAQARQENALLRQKIDLLIRRVSGASSEALDSGQLQLLLQVPSGSPAPSDNQTAASPESDSSSARSRRPRVPRLPDKLPVVEEVIEPEPVKAAPQDWRCIGQEVTEQLDYEPGRFLRRRLIRKKYVPQTFCKVINTVEGLIEHAHPSEAEHLLHGIQSVCVARRAVSVRTMRQGIVSEFKPKPRGAKSDITDVWV